MNTQEPHHRYVVIVTPKIMEPEDCYFTPPIARVSFEEYVYAKLFVAENCEKDWMIYDRERGTFETTYTMPLF